MNFVMRMSRPIPTLILTSCCLLAWPGSPSGEEAPPTWSGPSAPETTSAYTREANAPALLPNRLGPMETMLWSEHGFMRRAFDFPLTLDGREKELSLRRNMLTAHQIGGYLTFASMVTTCVLGQLIINGDEGLEDAKGAAIASTLLLYFGTASLSIFTPPPLVRREGWSTTSTHKFLGVIHFTGMIVTPILGTMIEDKHSFQTFHQVSGYLTTATFGAAMVVMMF